jgi:hypothetical protein
MSTRDEDLSLEQIADAINQRFRRGVENALEVGRLLGEAQRKLEGTSVTLTQWCADNFESAQSTLDTYKRLAVNLAKALPLRPTAHDEILTMGIIEADKHLAGILGNVKRAANKPARNTSHNKQSSKPVTLSNVNENSDANGDPGGGDDYENDGLHSYLLEVKAIIDSQLDAKERKRVLNLSISYLKGTVALEEVPDVQREYPDIEQGNGSTMHAAA